MKQVKNVAISSHTFPRNVLCKKIFFAKNTIFKPIFKRKMKKQTYQFRSIISVEFIAFLCSKNQKVKYIPKSLQTSRKSGHFQENCKIYAMYLDGDWLITNLF